MVLEGISGGKRTGKGNSFLYSVIVYTDCVCVCVCVCMCACVCVRVCVCALTLLCSAIYLIICVLVFHEQGTSC